MGVIGLLTKKHKAQLYPSKTRLVINDKSTKVLFTRDGDDFKSIISDGVDIREVAGNKKHGDILTPVKLSGFYNGEPLNMFDKAVFDVCCSELYNGNEYITAGAVHRALTGKTNTDDCVYRIYDKLKSAIVGSWKKMMAISLTIDMSELCTKLKYNGGQPFKITAPILPAIVADGAIINGQKTDAILIEQKPPLYEVADMKSQILRYDSSLLDIPNQNNTERIITAKNYVLARICEIKAHNLTPVITFADIFTKCNIIDGDRKQKSRVKDAVELLLKNIVVKNFIKSFEVTKRHDVSYAFSLSFK